MAQQFFSKETKGFAEQLELWRQRFSQRDIFSLWRSASNPKLREQFAFTIVATQPQTLKIMDSAMCATIMRDSQEHIHRLRELHGNEGLSPTTAAMSFVAGEIAEWETRRKARVDGDIVTSAQNLASEALHALWKQAVRIYPMSNEAIGALCFRVVKDLGSYGLGEIRPEFCAVVVLGAARHCARSTGNKLKDKPPAQNDVVKVMGEVKAYVQDGGRDPFNIPYLSKHASRAKQMRGLWEDAVCLSDMSQSDQEAASVWRQGEKNLAYSWVAIDPDEAVKYSGRDYPRLLAAAIEKAEELRKTPGLRPPRLTYAAAGARSPEDVIKVSTYALPPGYLKNKKAQGAAVTTERRALNEAPRTRPFGM